MAQAARSFQVPVERRMGLVFFRPRQGPRDVATGGGLRRRPEPVEAVWFEETRPGRGGGWNCHTDPVAANCPQGNAIHVAPSAPAGAGGQKGGSRFHGFRVGRLRRRAAPPVATARRTFGAKGETESPPFLPPIHEARAPCRRRILPHSTFHILNSSASASSQVPVERRVEQFLNTRLVHVVRPGDPTAGVDAFGDPSAA